MIDDAMAIIVAGGESRRMGRDKALLPLGEQSLLEHVLAAVHPLFSKVLVSVRQIRPEIDWPQVCDAYADAGPLAGLCAGLEQARAHNLSWIFLVATDMPFLKAALIEHLAQKRTGVQAVVPTVHGHPQPLAAFYSVACLPAIREIMEGDGRRSLRVALEKLRVLSVGEAELEACDSGLLSFFDLDTPQDMVVANELRSQPE